MVVKDVLGVPGVSGLPDKLTIKGLFTADNSQYETVASLTPPASENWTYSAVDNTCTWTAPKDVESKSIINYSAETKATFYIICKVEDTWNIYGEEEVNTATFTSVTFAQQLKTTGVESSPFGGDKTHGDKDEPKTKDDITKTPNISDDAKVRLLGYNPSISKEVIGIAAIITKADDPIIDDFSYFEWGDIVEYKITVKNNGTTNWYNKLYVHDALKQGLQYVEPRDSRYREYNSYFKDKVEPYNEWIDRSDSSRSTPDSEKDKYQNIDIGGIGEGLLTKNQKETAIVTEVIEEPGGDTINYTQLLGFHNRNGIEISTEDFDPYPEDSVETPVETYTVGVSKNISEIKSAGLTCSETKTNEVADQLGSGDEKNGITDRGDLVKFTIEVENKGDVTNLWKVKLKDTYDPGLEYVKYESSDTWVVNEGSNELTITYMSEGTEPKNDSDWEKIEPGGKVSIDLYFQVVDGAEFAQKGKKYTNTVTIEQVWNRNAKELEEENITNDPKEDSASIEVRQLSASIDKYVSGLFGGIEGDVSSTIVNASRARPKETRRSFDYTEVMKEMSPVEVERGDEITYTIVVRNNQHMDNTGGLISYFKILDTYDPNLIFSSCTGPVTCVDNGGTLDIQYTGHLLPEQSFEFKLVFIMTNPPDDNSALYEQIYKNTIQITELKNVNDWTWSLDGANNTHHDSCEFSGPCYLRNLINDGGITSDRESSDYVKMLAYAVELEKYVINVHHTNDDGSTADYNAIGNKYQPDDANYNADEVEAWDSNDSSSVDREYWNPDNINEKTKKKETYPVQLEKGDIVTYEVKIKNTYNYNNGGMINWTTLEPSIYKIDIYDVFSSEDETTIGSADEIGLKFISAQAVEGGDVIVNKINNRGYMFEFTPNGQCKNMNKPTNGYGIGSGEEATFTITVEVTRSNMYLYELINRASIQDVYNRNNSIGSYSYNSPEGRSGVIYKVTNGNRMYKDVSGNLVDAITVKDANGNAYETAKRVTDADYVNLKDLIISGYVWDDTDAEREEDGLMTWKDDDTGFSTDKQVEGDVWAYLYRVYPGDTGDQTGRLVMSTKVNEDGYYIFGDKNTTVHNTEENREDDRNPIVVNQKYRFEPINYKRPRIKVAGQVTKDTQQKEIYLNGFTNYRVVKAPNKDYNDNSTARYWLTPNVQYYQYYIEFEYNGMKYTHTVYGSDAELNNDSTKGTTNDRTRTESNQDGQYNLITSGRATRNSEQWLPWRTSPKSNSEYYEIDSNSAEFKSVREAFDNQFATVAYNKGIDGNSPGNETSLSYIRTENEHVSRYNYTSEVKIRARSFVTEWINPVEPKYVVGTGTYRNSLYKDYSRTVGNYTNTLFFWDSTNRTRTPAYTNIVGTSEETEYLKYINLGLKERPQLDLELIKDIDNVQVDINDKTMVYEYNCVTPDNIGRIDEDPDDKKYYTTGYELWLYKSDYYYRYTDYANGAVQEYKKTIEPENSELNPDFAGFLREAEADWLGSLGFNLAEEKSESELNIQITYKYTITNKSGMPWDNRDELIIGSVNEIVDYHSSDLIPNQTGRFVKNVNITGEGKNQDGNVSNYADASRDTNNDGKPDQLEGTVNVSTMWGNKNGNSSGYQTVNGDVSSGNQPPMEDSDGIHTVYISGLDDVRLYPNDSVDIYLTFTLSRNATVNENIGNAISLATKNNIAEISAFSTYYDDRFTTNWSKGLKTPGLVDKDSNPGNEEITYIMNEEVYEDDTYRVDITPKLYGDDDGNPDGERLIDGMVWEDVKTNAKGVNYGNDANPAHIIYETMQVVADGLYHGNRSNTDGGQIDKDVKIGGVDVELLEIITLSDGKVVYEDRAEIKNKDNSDWIKDNKGLNNNISILSTVTNEDGYYQLSGFIPGNYVVRFKYGNTCTTVDQGYNGQDYKSTTYQVNIGDNQYFAKSYDGYGEEQYTYVGNVWHDLLSTDVNGKVGSYENAHDLENLDHLSDARDDEVRRIEVSAYSRTVNNEVSEILNLARSHNHISTNNLHEKLIDKTWMFADTAKLQIEVEHIKYTKDNTQQEIDTSKFDNGRVKLYSYLIENRYDNEDIGNISIANYTDDGKLERKENGETQLTGIKIPYYVGNIDFGLEERPTTNVSLTKLVSGIKVETTDGEGILDIEYEPKYDSDGSLLLNSSGVPKVANTVTTGSEHMQALNSTTTPMWDSEKNEKADKLNEDEKADALKQIYRNLKTTQGFYYINIDEDLMQGAVITLRYSIVVTNESEVDTLGMLTGFKNGEAIYDEVANILSGNSNRTYDYVGNRGTTERNRKGSDLQTPRYVDGKILKDTNEGTLKYGYYMGATYYNGKYHPETYVVETRIDQIIDYVDNNLTVREEDNNTENNSWRTISLKELVEGEIQKDVVGQNYDDNYYKKDIDLKYVPYDYSKKGSTTKTINVSNVGNMLSDEVYRKKDLGVEASDPAGIESAIPRAGVTNVHVDEVDKESIKGTITNDDNTEKTVDVTIMDSTAREYITEQRNNILVSIPDENVNPNLYQYLIPAKALTAKPGGNTITFANNLSFSNAENIILNTYYGSGWIDGSNDYTLKELVEFTDAYYQDVAEGNITFAYSPNECRLIIDELIKNVKKSIEQQLSKYVYGTQNEEKIGDAGIVYEKINGESSAKINLTASRTISPESTADERDDLTFENIAEILQISNKAGRRDEYATVGDSNVWEGAWQAATGYTSNGASGTHVNLGGTALRDIIDRSSNLQELINKNKNLQDYINTMVGTANTGMNAIVGTANIGMNAIVGKTNTYDLRKEFGDEFANALESEIAKEIAKERYDTDTTEMVLLSPPTGLSKTELIKYEQEETQNNIILIAIVSLTMLSTIIIVIKIVNKKKLSR